MAEHDFYATVPTTVAEWQEAWENAYPRGRRLLSLPATRPEEKEERD